MNEQNEKKFIKGAKMMLSALSQEIANAPLSPTLEKTMKLYIELSDAIQSAGYTVWRSYPSQKIEITKEL